MSFFVPLKTIGNDIFNPATETGFSVNRKTDFFKEGQRLQMGLGGLSRSFFVLSSRFQQGSNWLRTLDRCGGNMKVFLWLLTLALAVMCLFLWALARIETSLLKAASISLPSLTQALVINPNWLLFCPVPWIVASLVLSCRKEVSSVVGFLFLGTIVLAASLILFPVLTALSFPWLARFANSISK